ncbi:hypothetical protein [Roseateles sp.]|uniref:hypothetical protein n=1 Tax=Roseateles sp. TaxID=1971397 RepID=UPI0039EBFED0
MPAGGDFGFSEGRLRLGGVVRDAALQDTEGLLDGWRLRVVFVVGWAVVLFLLAIWSGLAMAAHALLVAMLSHAGTMGAGDWSLPESLTTWLPQPLAGWLLAALETLAPQIQSLVGALPMLASGVGVLAWAVWGLGALLLLGVGLAGHLAVVLWRRTTRPSAQQPVVVPG